MKNRPCRGAAVRLNIAAAAALDALAAGAATKTRTRLGSDVFRRYAGKVAWQNSSVGNGRKRARRLAGKTVMGEKRIMRRAALWLTALLPFALSAAQPAFPGAVGFGTDTPGGRGGRILKVTSLAADGPGSLRAALEAKGPRIVVFEVGGVIDLNGAVLRIDEPFLTVAGQTAPSPGITLIGGGIAISAHDVVLRHLRVRPGDRGLPPRSGWEPDGITTVTPDDPGKPGPHNIVVDHCSLTWAVDENLSAGGVRHEGRERTAHRVTFSNNLVAEALANSTHAKGEHSKGTLIHDHARDIAVIGNLYACNVDRNPVLKPDAAAVIANNLICNPRRWAIHTYWNTREYQGRMETMLPATLVVVGNVLWAGPDTPKNLAMIFIAAGKGEVYEEDNLATGLDGQPRTVVGAPQPKLLERRPFWPEGFTALPADAVAESVLRHAGARPWERDAIDARIVAGVRERTARIIDSQEQVGGYPRAKPTHRALTVPARSEEVGAWLESFIPKEER
jgi:hypothetical protein